MCIGTAATVNALVGSTALAESTPVMTGHAECGGRDACHLSGIRSSVIAPRVVTDIVFIIRIILIGIVLIQSDIHLSHERVPVHTVTVEDGLIDIFLNIPTLGDIDIIGKDLAILLAFLADDIG